MRLGVKMVLDMAYSLKLPGLFKKPKGFNQLHFWTHSIGVAYLTRSLAYMVKISQEDIEFAYLCGLMHDTGILVFDHLIPDEYSEFLGTIKSSDITLAENEAETFGITHAELGARFIEKWWPVSPGLVEAIRIHHDSPGESGNIKHIATFSPPPTFSPTRTSSATALCRKTRHPWNTVFSTSWTSTPRNWKS
jgi:HD-like signal output (HDOD) protein